MKRLDTGKRVYAIFAAVALCVLVFAATASAELVVKRAPSGKQLRFSGPVQVWCGPWDESVARPSVHVLVGPPRRHWELSAVTGDVRLGRPIRFPHSVLSSNPHGAQLFVGVARPPIEASSAEEEASGSLTFSRLDCGPGGEVAFRVKAVLGSELFGGERVRVSGAFRGQVGEPPVFAPRAL
jgi:hypothetical protein